MNMSVFWLDKISHFAFSVNNVNTKPIYRAKAKYIPQQINDKFFLQSCGSLSLCVCVNWIYRRYKNKRSFSTIYVLFRVTIWSSQKTKHTRKSATIFSDSTTKINFTPITATRLRSNKNVCKTTNYHDNKLDRKMILIKTTFQRLSGPKSKYERIIDSHDKDYWVEKIRSYVTPWRQGWYSREKKIKPKKIWDYNNNQFCSVWVKIKNINICFHTASI